MHAPGSGRNRVLVNRKSSVNVSVTTVSSCGVSGDGGGSGGGGGGGGMVEVCSEGMVGVCEGVLGTQVSLLFVFVLGQVNVRGGGGYGGTVNINRGAWGKTYTYPSGQQPWGMQ